MRNWNHPETDLAFRRDVLGHEKAAVRYIPTGPTAFRLEFLTSGSHDQVIRLAQAELQQGRIVLNGTL